MNNKISIKLYILVIIVSAIALTRYMLGQSPITEDQVIPLITFTVFMIGVELFEIRTAAGGQWIPTSTLDLAVWVCLGPTVAMAMECLAVLVGDGLIKRRPLMKLFFNVPAMMLSAGIAGIFYHAMPWSDNLSSPLFLLPAMLSHLVFSIVNMGLASIVMALHEGISLRETTRRTFGWHFLSGLVTAPLSAFLIFSYQFAGLWSLLLFGLPLFSVWQAHKLFEQMKEAHKNTVAALTTALEADEPYTHGHSYRVAQYALAIARNMGMGAKDLETLEYAGMLHDIGKIAITNDIICKPARLTRDEFDILASHPAIGGEIVEQMKFLEGTAELVRHHHERPDGQGYPDKLKEHEINLGSHILCLCDAIDAMCSNRPYRAALSLEQCRQEVMRFRGTQFQVDVVDAFNGMVLDGSFQIIAQADGSAQEIQRILREAAEPFKYQVTSGAA